MKNICFVCYDLSVMGGAEKVATDVANALSESYKVHMIALSGKESALELNKNITAANLGLDLSSKRKAVKPAAALLKEYYKKHNISISFLVGNHAGFICCMAARGTYTKQVFCDHGALMNEWEHKRIRLIRFIAAMTAYHTIVLTKESMEDYIARFHINKKRISYIHNWINDISEHDYREDSKGIISAGRFVDLKGFHSVVPEVAALVKEKHPDWHWDIYGDGECFEAAKKRITELGLEDFLFLKGKVDNLNDIYKDYAMYVMTSRKEGMPLVLLEAKGKGLPIVAFDVKTGPSEIVRRDADGLLFENGDTDAMADGICRLIENEGLRKKMSRETRTDAERFSKTVILGQWIDFIEAN